MGFDVAPLLIYYPSQFAFHGLERVMDYFCQRIVRAVINLLFFRHQFMPGRNSDIDSNPVWVSLFMGMIRLFDGDVSSADMIAEFVQPCCLFQHHLFNSEGFF